MTTYSLHLDDRAKIIYDFAIRRYEVCEQEIDALYRRSGVALTANVVLCGASYGLLDRLDLSASPSGSAIAITIFSIGSFVMSIIGGAFLFGAILPKDAKSCANVYWYLVDIEKFLSNQSPTQQMDNSDKAVTDHPIINHIVSRLSQHERDRRPLNQVRRVRLKLSIKATGISAACLAVAALFSALT